MTKAKKADAPKEEGLDERFNRAAVEILRVGTALMLDFGSSDGHLDTELQQLIVAAHNYTLKYWRGV